MKAFDALVIGAGPAGASAALMLARSGWSVALAEKSAFPRRKVCGEFISATTWPLLRDLGVASVLEPDAGPEVRRVGFFARDTVIEAPMPRAGGASDGWGRAIERACLDPALLEAARAEGAEVLQPATVERLSQIDDGFDARISSPGERTPMALRARVVIAAHGSWEHGELASQPAREAPRAGDLFGFKAHFTASSLKPGLMPLIVFPGGYGGMVHTGAGRVSFSCCIRRDALAACRRARPGMAAGEAVIAHVMASSEGVARALGAALLAGPWLSAGPIRPGIRPRARAGLFAIGNAAGEAHPLVAEGISMAIQSAWLLCQALLVSPATAAHDYPAAWRRHFATRVRASSLFAAATLSPATAGASIALMKHIPSMLTWGARWSGKAHTLRMGVP